MCNKASVIPTQTKFLPQNLTEEEIQDPYLVIHDLFDFDHLPGIRELLWDSFKIMITGDYTHTSDKQKKVLVTVYEKMEKLVEAAHIIHESRCNCAEVKQVCEEG